MISSKRRVLPALLALVVAVSPALAASSAGDAVSPAKGTRLPALAKAASFKVRGTPADTRTIGDVDILSDGRIAVLDYDARRVAIFGADGTFDRFLKPPTGSPPEKTLIPRLVALPEGGLVLAVDEGKFLFYDQRLERGAVVPFGIDTMSLNGFVRHPSGDLYVVAVCRENDKILHRFDLRGRYIQSSVDALDVPYFEKAHSSGMVAVDPEDGTLWLTRVTPYEILHLTPEGKVLGRIVRDLPGFAPPRAERIDGNWIKLSSLDFFSGKIAIIDGMVVNSYVNRGVLLADVFQRDGTLVETELTPDSPLAFAKRVGDGIFVRHFNDQEPRVEVWRKRS